MIIVKEENENMNRIKGNTEKINKEQELQCNLRHLWTKGIISSEVSYFVGILMLVR